MNSSNISTEKTQSAEEEVLNLKMSDRLHFFLQNFRHIIELEKNLRFVLSENEIKKNTLLVLKICEGGWLPFREVFRLQKIFEEEKSFFQALDFIKRVEICQDTNNIQKEPNSTQSILIKLNENFGNPFLNFYLRKKENSEQVVQDLIQKSIFKDQIKNFEISEAQGLEDSENSLRKTGKVTSDFSSIISGLKYFLSELAPDQVSNLCENYFNLDAKPFKPKNLQSTQQPISAVTQLDLGFAQSSLQSSSLGKSQEDKEQTQLEKKRQISQMYQYYNYLIFEKNKESFNDINPDLRKMTYKYDAEVKNAYMTVQASPEVIKAAMGMNIATQNGHSLMGKVDDTKEESKVANSDDVLKLAKKSTSTSSGKTIRYNKDQILQIYKNLGNFKSPLIGAGKNGLKPENIKFLELIVNNDPNVVLESFKEMPPPQGDKVRIVNSYIENANKV